MNAKGRSSTWLSRSRLRSYELKKSRQSSKKLEKCTERRQIKKKMQLRAKTKRRKKWLGPMLKLMLVMPQ